MESDTLPVLSKKSSQGYQCQVAASMMSFRNYYLIEQASLDRYVYMSLHTTTRRYFPSVMSASPAPPVPILADMQWRTPYPVYLVPSYISLP